jgi:hypothetical protein
MVGIRKTMTEFEAGKLRSGSKHGPIVKSLAQARAIGLSEERKEGHKVAFKHEPTAPGHMGKEHDHHIEQGHKVSGHERKNDGAGRRGHDMELRGRTEHKEPHHPAGSHTKQGYDPMVEHGKAGYPGEHMRMGHEHDLVGENYSQTAHEPAVLKTPDGQGFTAGHPGIHAGMAKQPSGYGHQAHQKSGPLRNSGHPGAHRIGKR